MHVVCTFFFSRSLASTVNLHFICFQRLYLWTILIGEFQKLPTQILPLEFIKVKLCMKRISLYVDFYFHERGILHSYSLYIKSSLLSRKNQLIFFFSVRKTSCNKWPKKELQRKFKQFFSRPWIHLVA